MKNCELHQNALYPSALTSASACLYSEHACTVTLLSAMCTCPCMCAIHTCGDESCDSV